MQDQCVAKLRRAECKRIPRPPSSYLHGYYVGCPSCGLAQAVTPLDATILEEGMGDGEMPRLSVTAVVCRRCGCRYRIDRDECTIERAPDAPR